MLSIARRSQFCQRSSYSLEGMDTFPDVGNFRFCPLANEDARGLLAPPQIEQISYFAEGKTELLRSANETNAVHRLAGIEPII